MLFYNITGSTGVTVELMAHGANSEGIKSILLTNIDTAAITVDLFIQEDLTNVRYHLLYNVSLPLGASLLLDSNDMLAFNNKSEGFSLNLKLGSTSDLINVLIKR